MVVIAVRLFAMLDGAGDRHGRPPELPLGAPIWRDTRVLLPAGAAATNWQDALTDASHTGGGDSLQLAQVLRAFPGAVLVGRD
jgi:maltooligosyltrehalose synthase